METISQSITRLTRNRSKTSIIRDSYKWFIYSYIDRNDKSIVSTSEFLSGYIYVFNYDPEYKNVKYKNGSYYLPFYDSMPMVYCLGYINTSNGLRMIGINISYLPPKIRIKFLDKLITKFGHYIDKNDARLRENKKYSAIDINYEKMKLFVKNSGFEFAIRSYIPTRIKNKPLVVEFSRWYSISLFASKFISRMNIKAIYVKYKQNIDDTYRIGKRDPKVKF